MRRDIAIFLDKAGDDWASEKNFCFLEVQNVSLLSRTLQQTGIKMFAEVILNRLISRFEAILGIFTTNSCRRKEFRLCSGRGRIKERN